ncbi:VOC family protein [Streptomyces sp. NPDC057654]|uniref:VOC family protein n=1 Tax=Streptomyces sp. NPDC057654 TaxID=3346196 RepID=UPI0036C7409A
MTIRRVNHLVLSVADIAVSTRFYRDTLGLKVVDRIPKDGSDPFMVFLRTPEASDNHHDLGLIRAEAPDAQRPEAAPPGLLHFAFEVGSLDELAEIKERLEAQGRVKETFDQGMHLSVYCTDPDGIEIELMWPTPRDSWSYEEPIVRKPLDIEGARRRWGGTTAGL